MASASTTSPSPSSTDDGSPVVPTRSGAHTEPSSAFVDLAPQKRREIMERINATVDDVLDSMVGDGPSKTYWRPKGIKKDVAYFVDDNVNPDQYRFCCVKETNARADEIIQLFLLTDTETLLKNNRILYNNVLDARVLSVLQTPTRENPCKSVYLRYSAYAAPKPMGDRDLCVVVATDVFTHDDGSTIGYCLWDSVDILQCPDYRKSRGLVRGRMFRSGFFCRTTIDDCTGVSSTKIVYLVGIEPGGITAPRLAALIVMDKFGANLARLCSYFRRKQLDPTTFRPRSEWPSTTTTKHCRACAKSLRGFTVRHNCAACGDVFCKPCYTKENVDLPGAGITAVRFCHHCLGIRGIETTATCRSNERVQRRRRSVGSTNTMENMPLAMDTRHLQSSQADTASSTSSSSSPSGSSAAGQVEVTLYRL